MTDKEKKKIIERFEKNHPKMAFYAKQFDKAFEKLNTQVNNA